MTATAIRHRSGILESCWGDPTAALAANEEDENCIITVVPDRRNLVLVGEVLSTPSGHAFGTAVAACFSQAMRLEARLSRAQRDFRDLIESSPDPLAILGGGLVLYANPAWCDTIAAEDRTQVPNTPVLAWVLPADRDLAAKHLRSATTAHVEVRVANVPSRWVELAAPRAVRFDGARAELLVARDVTDRRAMQEGLLVSDRMATIGLLAAGVAHEINNPLTAIVANVEVATREVALQLADANSDPWLHELRSELDDTRLAADQVRSIVRDLRVFSRSHEEAPVPVDIRRVLESSIKMATRAVKHSAVVERDYEDVPMVAATPSRLGQVFLNILVNAAQAFTEPANSRNRITVQIKQEVFFVAVSVTDNGPGIATEVLPRLFQPFVTTKPQGEGTGLGLSICQRLISALDGRIEVESSLGQGTTFRVLLPALLGDELEAATPTEEIRIRNQARSRVLVIDDEPLIGRAVGRMLSGDDVVSVQDGRLALTQLQTDTEWDLILLDLMMPGLTGMDVYNAIRNTQPNLLQLVVLMSGGTFTPESREFVDRVKNRRIEKPFDRGVLRQLLDGGDGRPHLPQS